MVLAPRLQSWGTNMVACRREKEAPPLAALSPQFLSCPHQVIQVLRSTPPTLAILVAGEGDTSSLSLWEGTQKGKLRVRGGALVDRREALLSRNRRDFRQEGSRCC